MTDHHVVLHADEAGTRIAFPPIFNVAVPFIDRHLHEGRGEKVAIRTTAGESVTYGALAAQVNRAGNALLDLGIAPGDRLLMVVKDCPAFFYLFWGAIKAGIIPVPLNTLLRTPDYQYMIEDSDAAAVVFSPEFAAEVEPAIAAAAHRPRHVLRTEGNAESLMGLMDHADDVLAPHRSGPEDDCFWLYSSGSTGKPKGGVHIHRSMVVTSQYYGVETIGLTEDDICFSAAKLFFAYGLGNAMTFPLWVGASAVLAPDRPTAEMTFDVIARFRPTYYFGVPTLYAAQLKAMPSAVPDLSSLRACVSAGEALPSDIFDRWRARTGLAILEGIGTTEALHIFISSQPDAFKPGFTGRIVPGYDARIIDDEGREVPVGQPGNLLIRALSGITRYWNKPEKTAATVLGDGWLATGDVYVQDAEGFFQCGGRSDDMLKVGGIWCSPVEIEAKLVEHPAVLEAAVVGRADANSLIKPEAFVVLNDPAQAGERLEQALRTHCRDGLAPYKYPRWLHFVDDLPKTATGKIQRFKLRDAARQSAAPSLEADGT